jgi:hypothetical protein
MTIEIVEFRCPTCGHILGEEEHRHALSKHEELKNKYREENQQLRSENQQIHEKFDRELQNRVTLEVQSQKDRIRSEEQEKAQQEIRKKNEEIVSLKSQNEQVTSVAVEQAISCRDVYWRQREDSWRLKFEKDQLEKERLQKDIRELQNKVKRPNSESSGTAGERILTKDLHKAFPRDDLVEKRVGEEMPDIIQTIVLENGERIATPILWDMKTGEIKPNDIEKAKRYKEKYNTDYCIIASQRLIEHKYTKNGIEGYLGKRDGITLLHTSMAGEIAEEIRNFVIKETRLIKNNNGRTSKQSKLYDYITSPERFRKIQKKIRYKEELKKLIRLQQDYNAEKWTKQIELVEKSLKLDSDDEQEISGITETDRPEGGEDDK